jgi:hypothetical protein
MARIVVFEVGNAIPTSYTYAFYTEVVVADQGVYLMCTHGAGLMLTQGTSLQTE